MRSISLVFAARLIGATAYLSASSTAIGIRGGSLTEVGLATSTEVTEYLLNIEPSTLGVADTKLVEVDEVVTFKLKKDVNSEDLATVPTYAIEVPLKEKPVFQGRAKSLTPPLLVCWEISEPSLQLHRARLVLRSKESGRILHSVNLLEVSRDNLFQYFLPQWNTTAPSSSKQCTHIPVCLLLDAHNKAMQAALAHGEKGTFIVSSVELEVLGDALEGTGARMVIRGAAISDSEADTVEATLAGQPFFVMHFPRKGNGAHAVLAAAKSRGVIFEFGHQHWAWIPEYARAAYAKVLERLQRLAGQGGSSEADLSDPATDDPRDYEIAGFVPKRDMPLRFQAFTFIPRVFLEIVTGTRSLRKCLPSASQALQFNNHPLESFAGLLSASSGSTENALRMSIMELLYTAAEQNSGERPTSIIRVQSVIEAVAIEGLVSGQDAMSTINLPAALIDEYLNHTWTINISLADITP